MNSGKHQTLGGSSKSCPYDPSSGDSLEGSSWLGTQQGPEPPLSRLGQGFLGV